MTDFAALKVTLAQDIADAVAAVQAGKLATIPVTAIALTATYTWDGTGVVLTPDTSQVLVNQHIRLDANNNWYLIQSIDPGVSVTVSDKFLVGSFPVGETQSSFTKSALPNPPSSETLKETLGEPIGDAVVDAIQSALADAQVSGVSSGSDTIGPGVIS